MRLLGEGSDTSFLTRHGCLRILLNACDVFLGFFGMLEVLRFPYIIALDEWPHLAWRF